MENFDLLIWLCGIASYALGWWTGYELGDQNQRKNKHVLWLRYREHEVLLQSLEAQAEYGDPKSFARKRAEQTIASMKVIQTIYNDLYGTDIRNHHAVSGRAQKTDVRSNGARSQKKRSGNGPADL